MSPKILLCYNSVEYLRSLNIGYVKWTVMLPIVLCAAKVFNEVSARSRSSSILHKIYLVIYSLVLDFRCHLNLPVI